ncbi:DNA alkylation repair protein [Agromyces luteolus]|uniref:DNA alkylation repair protein n=1 Tax=Agromyces luteolus TaxID=88373 RepID=A0A7C9MFZ7_9MICO|nr:DNA alkylation repair protein [Agromyces luteolus]MUN06298.1 DNA alkylation repair protein [Agromyces luteolus]
MAEPADATAAGVRAALAAVADPARAAASARFFKTGPGEYGEGDAFLGVTVPQLRVVAKGFRDLPLLEIRELLDSAVHEVRLCALVVLVDRFDRASRVRTRDDAERARIAAFYLGRVRAGRVDNWDLVDASADRILGAWLLDPAPAVAGAADGTTPAPGPEVLDDLVANPDLWQRRAGIMATFAFLKAGDGGPTLRLAPRLLDDPHDLIHKATGWMLRELGARVDRAELERFLDRYAARMPRTMLSYATEHLEPAERARYRAMR